MRLPRDTHVLLACIDRRLEELPNTLRVGIERPEDSKWVSVVSLWEVAIEWRLGKLPIAVDLEKWPEALKLLGFGLLAIEANHVFADIAPELSHRDPFDRLLLGICAAENMQLVTIDRAMTSHPLAWRGA